MSASITWHPHQQRPNVEWSIIIPTWNNLPFLKLTIASIIKNTKVPVEILVHVNEGHDGTITWLQQQGMSYSYSKNNVGVCYAMNAAAAMATTNYVVLTDDDKYYCPGWDTALAQVIASQTDDWFCASGTMIERKDTGNPCVLAPYDFGSNPDDFQEAKLLAAYKDLPLDNWQGANWYPLIVSKNLWQLVGGMSTEFTPGMYSDPDFMMKLYHAGVRRFYGVSAARVYHFMSKSTARVKKNDGKATFLNKWGLSAGYFNKHLVRLGALGWAEAAPPKTSTKYNIKRCFVIPPKGLASYI